MAIFNKTVITEKGYSLIAKSILNNSKINFTKIVASDYDYSKLSEEDIEQLEALEDIKQSVLVNDVKVINESTVNVSGILSNTELKEEYYLRAIGLFAADPQENKEILYSITVAKEADCFPSFDGNNVSNVLLDLETIISKSSKIDLEVNPNATATIKNLNDLENKINEKVEDITTHLNENAQNINNKLNRFTSRIDANINPITLECGHYMVEGNLTTDNGYPVNGHWNYSIIVSGEKNDTAQQGHKKIILVERTGLIYVKTQDLNIWSTWQQLATTDKIINNLTTNQEGFALDARQGKTLYDLITPLRSALFSGGLREIADLNVNGTTGIYRVANTAKNNIENSAGITINLVWDDNFKVQLIIYTTGNMYIWVWYGNVLKKFKVGTTQI